MLTDDELHRPYLNPGFALPIGMLAMYWTAILERPVTREEVTDALNRLSDEYCVDHVAECEANRLYLQNLTRNTECPLCIRK